MRNNELTAEQYEQLIKPINPSRVKQIDGMSHVEAYDVKAHLNRIFGFCNWSAQVTESHLAYEDAVSLKSGKPGYKVGYRVRLRLDILVSSYCSYEEEAFGESMMPEYKRGDAHHMALTTAASTALKRCAINLGDQFGLSLYNAGSTNALVKNTLIKPISQPAVKIDPEYALDMIAKINDALNEKSLKEVWVKAEADDMLDVEFDDGSGDTLKTILLDRLAAMRDA